MISIPDTTPGPIPNLDTSCYSDSTRDGVLSIGGVSHKVKTSHKHVAMVPDILFYDNQQVSQSITVHMPSS